MKPGIDPRAARVPRVGRPCSTGTRPRRLRRYGIQAQVNNFHLR